MFVKLKMKKKKLPSVKITGRYDIYISIFFRITINYHVALFCRY